MGFFEWLGLVFGTFVLTYSGGAVSAIVAGVRSSGGLEALPVVLVAFIAGAASSFLLSLWLLWDVNLFPFIEATK